MALRAQGLVTGSAGPDQLDFNTPVLAGGLRLLVQDVAGCQRCEFGRQIGEAAGRSRQLSRCTAQLLEMTHVLGVQGSDEMLGVGREHGVISNA